MSVAVSEVVVGGALTIGEEIILLRVGVILFGARLH